VRTETIVRCGVLVGGVRGKRGTGGFGATQRGKGPRGTTLVFVVYGGSSVVCCVEGKTKGGSEALLFGQGLHN